MKEPVFSGVSPRADCVTQSFTSPGAIIHKMLKGFVYMPNQKRPEISGPLAIYFSAP
jgi:hypothetical protein